MALILDVGWPREDHVRVTVSERRMAVIRRMVNSRPDLLRADGRDVVVQGMFGERNVVPDVDRFRIHGIGGDSEALRLEPHAAARDAGVLATYPFVDRVIACGGSGVATLLILLESPHKDEYGAHMECPLGPARGRTGARIEKELIGILQGDGRARRLLADAGETVRVLVSNPIPFQTSLYAVHRGRLGGRRGLRDAIWRGLWRMESDGNRAFQDQFLGRVTRYAPDVIVNACTGGDGGLRGEIGNFLDDAGYRERLFTAIHPAAWTAGTTLALGAG